MLLSDRISRQKSSVPGRALRRLAGFAAIVMLSAVTACTVTPLYQSQTAQTGFAAQTADKLALISIEEVNTRQAQQVRNHLIFLLGGGAGQPANPDYVLTLSVASGETGVATVQLPTENDGRPSAGALVVSGSYTLKDVRSQKVIGTGSRSVTAAFDRPRQEYAVYRARRDAEDRAAREVAEFLRLSIAQKLQTEDQSTDESS